MKPARTSLRGRFSNPCTDALSGLAVALALIPEALGFPVLAGVDLEAGLYAAVVIASTSARPAMITAARTSVSAAYIIVAWLCLCVVLLIIGLWLAVTRGGPGWVCVVAVIGVWLAVRGI